MIDMQEFLVNFPNLKDKPDDYKKAIYNKYTNFINLSELPPSFHTNNIDTSKLPKYIKILYDNISTIVNDNYSLMLLFNDYEFTHNICTLIINRYFYNSIMQDTFCKSILYIDTNLLMSDYKKLMTQEDDISPSIIHSKYTLYKFIEEADMVLWDKCTKLSSNYDKSKFYDILSVRYRKGLGNIYFGCGSTKELSSIFDKDTFISMNIDNVIDCSLEQLVLLDNPRKESVVW